LIGVVKVVIEVDRSLNQPTDCPKAEARHG
jgi:hypothetical protein